MQHLLILSHEEYSKLTTSIAELETASVENFKQEVRDYINNLNRWHSKRVVAVAEHSHDYQANRSKFMDWLNHYDNRNPQPTFPSCLK